MMTKKKGNSVVHAGKKLAHFAARVALCQGHAWMRQTILAVLLFGCACPWLPATSLIENSPFIPEGFKSKNQKSKINEGKPNLALRDIELRGIYSLDSDYYFNIFNKSAQKGQWVGLNDPSGAYRIVRYDESSDRIQINLEGKTEEMYLKKPDNKPIPVKTATAARQPASARGNSANTSRSTQRQGNPVVRRRVITPNRNRTGTQAPQRARPTPPTNRSNNSTDAAKRNSPSSAQDLLRQLGNQ